MPNRPLVRHYRGRELSILTIRSARHSMVLTSASIPARDACSRFALLRSSQELIRERGLKRLLTGGRIPSYARFSQEMTPQEYVPDVVAGKRKDPTLSFQLANGLVVLDVVPEYLEDTDSRGFATLLEWLNPEYVTTISLQALPEVSAEADAGAGTAEHRSVQTGFASPSMQYLLRPITCFQDFSTQVEFFVRSAPSIRSHFVLFPEYFTMQLLSYLREPARRAPCAAWRSSRQITRPCSRASPLKTGSTSSPERIR